MILQGDALTVLKTLPDASVNCCITSPPYYGLRDYGCDGQIGLERTPAEYIARLVDVFREVRRVLRDDGTCWINIGDSYAAQGGDHSKFNSNQPNVGASRCHANGSRDKGNRRPATGLKPKDLIGIPWMLAFALRDDGWYLRQDIIWAKGNCMPESVKDRCTKAHEHIFMLSKSARYFYDYDAISEPTQPDSVARYSRGRADDAKYADGGPGNQTIARSFEHMQPKQDGRGRRYSGFNEREFSGDPRERRNKRSWWLMNTKPCSEAHFAVYPLELPETCLLAGTKEGGTVLDPFCGAGTTGLACLKNGREFIGIELNTEYVKIAEARAQKYYPLLAGDVA